MSSHERGFHDLGPEQEPDLRPAPSAPKAALSDWPEDARQPGRPGRVLEFVGPGDNFFVCADPSHPPVRMFVHDECEACGGSDDYGSDFCPIEEFCCGC